MASTRQFTGWRRHDNLRAGSRHGTPGPAVVSTQKTGILRAKTVTPRQSSSMSYNPMETRPMPNRIIRLRTVLDRTGLSAPPSIARWARAASRLSSGSACMALDGARRRSNAGSRTRPAGALSPRQPNDLGRFRLPFHDARHEPRELGQRVRLLRVVGVAVIDALHARNGVTQHPFADIGSHDRARHQRPGGAADVIIYYGWIDRTWNGDRRR